MTHLSKNVVANYLGKCWNFLSLYLFVPVYIKILGIENYAIINFHAVLMSIMLIADAGLSASLNREIAKSDDNVYRNNLLRTIELIYGVIAILGFLLIFLLSDYISSKWLNSQKISASDLSYYIKLMGASICLHLLVILYNSGLMGLQKQVLSNSLQILFSLFRQGFVLIPLIMYKSLESYFIWQLFVTLIFFILTRKVLLKQIMINVKPVFKLTILKTVSKFAAGMLLMALIASLNTQLDKLLVSKLLSLEYFGFYTISATFAQISSILILPIMIAILPKMTIISEQNNQVGLKKIFHKFSFIVNSLACTITMILFIYTEEFLYLWTNNQNLVNTIAVTTKILLVGGLFLSFQYLPYYLSIANGHTLINIVLGLLIITISAPSLFYSINKLGIVGASLPWLFSNIIGAFLLAFFVIKKFLNGQFKSWFIYDTMVPLIITLSIGILFYYTTKNHAQGIIVIFLGTIGALVNLILCAFVYSKMFLNLPLTHLVKLYGRK